MKTLGQFLESVEDNLNEDATVHYGIAAYGHTLPKGHHSFADFAKHIQQHYDMHEPRNKALVDKLNSYKKGKLTKDDNKISYQLSESMELMETAFEGVDPHKVQTLHLHSEHTRHLVDRKADFIKNVHRKLKRGVYDENKAPKLWQYYADEVAKHYATENKIPGKISNVFNKATRSQFAHEVAKSELDSIKQGEYSHILGESENVIMAESVESSDQTYYSPETHPDVRRALENARGTGNRVRIWYGDSKTGKAWDEEHDVVGRIGRSTGSKKIPLILHSERSSGGPSVLDSSIVRIDNIERKSTVYKHPSFDAGKWEVRPETDPKHISAGYTHQSLKDGQLIGRHKSESAAKNYTGFMTGERYSK